MAVRSGVGLSVAVLLVMGVGVTWWISRDAPPSVPGAGPAATASEPRRMIPAAPALRDVQEPTQQMKAPPEAAPSAATVAEEWAKLERAALLALVDDELIAALPGLVERALAGDAVALEVILAALVSPNPSVREKAVLPTPSRSSWRRESSPKGETKRRREGPRGSGTEASGWGLPYPPPSSPSPRSHHAGGFCAHAASLRLESPELVLG